MEIYRQEPKLHQTWGLSVFQNNTSAPKQLAAPHWHEVYEVLFIRRGTGSQRINAETAPISVDDVVVICPGDVHATSTDSSAGCDIDVVQFTAALRGTEDLHSGILHLQGDSLRSQFDALRSCVQDDRPGQPLRMNGLGQLLVGHLIGAGCRKTSLPCSHTVQEICAYLEQAQDLNLKQTAAHFHYSPEHLSRKFRAETGLSYRDRCEQIRMRRAISMLHSGQTAVASLADALGYSDSSSFIRAFKRVYGITPSLYSRLLLPATEQEPAAPK